MKVAFPLMGNLYSGLKSCLESLEVDCVKNIPITKRTLELGIKYSPEFACFPFKINIGNSIEVLENGADTLLFAGGFGPCRFGYYGETQVQILKQLGYKFDYLIVEMIDKNQNDFINKLSKLSNNKNILQVLRAIYLGYYKIKLLDKVTKLSCFYRPREKNKGLTNQLVEHSNLQINSTNNIYKLMKFSKEINFLFNSISIDSNKYVIPVGLIGEIYTLLEPKINHNVENKLGNMGLEVHKSLFLSKWIKDHLFLDSIGYDYSKSYRKYSNKYLNREIGGHTCENLGNVVQFIKNKGCQGIIHLAPLTCMPEIVTKEILPEITEEYSVPYMSIFIDEQTGEAGFNTRLEAFADLITSSKVQKESYFQYP